MQLNMRKYSTLPSVFLLQQHNSGLNQNLASDPTNSFQMNEGLENNHVYSSGFGYSTPTAQICSSSNVDKERHILPPFESVMLRESRKRPLEEEFAPRDGGGIFSMISNTTFPEQSVNAQLLKAPAGRRSQKLSDKITSLQKVVSPYGKTDTASVLQEASMFINIAHQEIRRLTVSYFGTRPLHPQLMHTSTQKWYPDLRSKDLCVVPLSMATQFDDEDSGDVSSQRVPKMINTWGF